MINYVFVPRLEPRLMIYSMPLYLTLAFVKFTQIVSLHYCYISMITKYGLFDPILQK
jgi:hypothetical protein